MGEDQLKSVWLALDEDKSGLISTGEFGKFMRLGAHVHDTAEPYKTKVMRARKAVGAATRQEKDDLREERKQLLAVDDAARRSKAMELYNVAWGLQSPADSRPIWRSPRSYLY